MILAVPSRQSVADFIGLCDILSILLAPIAHASCDDLSPILMAAPLRRPAVDSLAAPLRAPCGDWPQIRSLCHRAYLVFSPLLWPWRLSHPSRYRHLLHIVRAQACGSSVRRSSVIPCADGR